MRRRTLISQNLVDGVLFEMKETTDSRTVVLEFTSKKPIKREEVLGMLLVIVQKHAPNLLGECDDGFSCH